MSDYHLDENGIYMLGKASQVDYPDSGHSDTANFEKNSFWFSHRNQVIASVLKRIHLNGNFADIGGGNGLQAAFIQEQFPDTTVTLIEPGYLGCINAKKRGIKNVYNSLFEDFDFDKFNVRTVGLFDVIEHVRDDVKFLSQLSAKLQKGSKIVITVPSYQWLWSETDDYGNHYRRYNKKMMHTLAQNSGLTTIYFSYFFSYLVPLTFAIRALPYRLRSQASRDSIIQKENKHHHPPRIINDIFTFLNEKELSMISKSSCTFGASIVVVFEVT